MYLIVGLGNPEEEYNRTRHNMGFCVINHLAQKCNISLKRSKFEGQYGKGEIDGNPVILLKPQTYMNLSGKAIVQFVNFYKIPLENVIIIYDDIDIESGIFKIRKKGGPGTHNGMKSVIQELGEQEFPRVRMGIGQPEHKGDLINHVLSHIPDEEYAILQEASNMAADAIITVIKHGTDLAMNRYN